MADMAKFYKILDWKEFNVNLNAVKFWLSTNTNDQFCGLQSVKEGLQVWFKEEPSQEIKDAIDAYWDGISADSDEAKSYVSKEDLKNQAEAKKASGKAKLLALGLSEEEIAALVG